MDCGRFGFLYPIKSVRTVMYLFEMCLLWAVSPHWNCSKKLRCPTPNPNFHTNTTLPPNWTSLTRGGVAKYLLALACPSARVTRVHRRTHCQQTVRTLIPCKTHILSLVESLVTDLETNFTDSPTRFLLTARLKAGCGMCRGMGTYAFIRLVDTAGSRTYTD